MYCTTVLAGDVSYSNTASTVSESILLSRFDAMRIIVVGALAGRQEWLKQFAHAKVFVLRRGGGNLEPVVFDRLANVSG